VVCRPGPERIGARGSQEPGVGAGLGQKEPAGTVPAEEAQVRGPEREHWRWSCSQGSALACQFI